MCFILNNSLITAYFCKTTLKMCKYTRGSHFLVWYYQELYIQNWFRYICLRKKSRLFRWVGRRQETLNILFHA